MPEFCRHGRFLQNCRICSKPEPAPARRPAPSGGTGAPGKGRSARTSHGRPSGMVVKRMARAVEDGYENELVPGLKASGDARRLAGELAFATARLAELAADPPGLYAEAALADDREEGLWLAFLIAHLSPLAGDGPAGGEPASAVAGAFATIAARRTSWASGELPPLETGTVLGPRTTVDAKSPHRTLTAYRAWVERHGGGSQLAALTGEPSWTPERRFQRVFERLSLPGLGRGGRFELLVSIGRLGFVEAAPGDLQLVEAGDEAVLAAKRVFGIGERMLMERRAADLAEAAGVPLAALDLALFNFGQPEQRRATMGSSADPDRDLQASVERTLGV